MPHRPQWFRDGATFVSFADTCGINKDGNTLYVVDRQTGTRTTAVDDGLAADIALLLDGQSAGTGRWVPHDDLGIGAPRYYDTRSVAALDELLGAPDLKGFSARSIGSLVQEGLLEYRNGHGSPSADTRQGDIPYIKVSDVRAGQININPSNMVSDVVAKRFWKSDESGLKPFDLIAPIRASKNIGEFAVLMPGQENMVLTKEMLVLRTAPAAPADNFYLLWALSLKVVRQQWNRVVLMQTNREDVGSRYLEIQIPWPEDAVKAGAVSKAFRTYYTEVDRLRRTFVRTITADDRHHVFLGNEGASE